MTRERERDELEGDQRIEDRHREADEAPTVASAMAIRAVVAAPPPLSRLARPLVGFGETNGGGRQARYVGATKPTRSMR